MGCACRPTKTSGKLILPPFPLATIAIIACKLLAGLSKHALALVAILATIFALTFPLSETTAGGNYNLHYLPASLRRNLRPQIGAFYAGVTEVAGRPFPAYSLVPEAPISLYIPGAGFLWSDDLTWDIASHDFRWKDGTEQTIAPDQASALDAIEDKIFHVRPNQSRIIFSDKFNTVGPWFLQQVPTGQFDPSDPVLTARIWPGQLVYLRQFQTGDFATASMDGLAISDMYEDMLDDDVRRFYVSAHHEDEFAPLTAFATSSASEHASPLSTSIWQIVYDAHRDTGFRLWNKAANCFLATSYRTYPNMRGRTWNDTILEAMHLELEACCTYPASRAASSFHAVDGVPKPSTPLPWFSRSPLQSTSRLSQLRTHGHSAFALMRAVWALSRFRGNHAHLQDMPGATARLHLGVPYTTGLSRAISTVIFCCILMHLGTAIYSRRWSGVSQKRQVTASAVVMLQLGYLVLYLVRSVLCGGDMREGHFALGVAWIGIVDWFSVVHSLS
ncbi:uncharacterized protein DSM5745_11221 [Aspergillus mulundensis]|uniref:Uncharacterized protein n=1 Tax=Aspergillus mulundensis TaxID=1810919 RepID=A0A3D8QA28_9EURO|nr:hypothetical protein DSM5745_11221 [Aspergillus mulundensis]RDW58530.1 hypothetical protein DSM5745_11221 [Aspergillus mulundensis]